MRPQTRGPAGPLEGRDTRLCHPSQPFASHSSQNTQLVVRALALLGHKIVARHRQGAHLQVHAAPAHVEQLRDHRAIEAPLLLTLLRIALLSEVIARHPAGLLPRLVGRSVLGIVLRYERVKELSQVYRDGIVRVSVVTTRSRAGPDHHFGQGAVSVNSRAPVT